MGTKKALATKLFIDNTIFTFGFYHNFFIANALINGQSIADGYEKMRKKMW